MNANHIYKRRLDSIYHYLLVYVIGIASYIILKGRIEEGSFTFIYSDPILYLFAGILIIILLYLLWSVIEQKEIVISDSAFIYRTRFKEWVYPVTTIVRIRIGFEKGTDPETRGRIVRMKTTRRRAPLVIRLRNYERSEELKTDIIELRKKILK